MNHLLKLSKLKNLYFAIRHGESQANVLGKIVSHPENGIGGYGLTTKGKEQVIVNIKTYREVWNKPVILSSDFLRAKETAQIIAQQIGVNSILYTDQLHERNFGILELQPNQKYKEVWEKDKLNYNNKQYQVESVESVTNRTTELICQLETKYQDQQILLVSHGDTLQLLTLAFLNKNPHEICAIPHLKNAEVRELKLSF
ncbi:MAG: histidine phosphatase family protein [Spirochaetes bacterium]|nr:histidine phosphatase family protein [Spirochaetota bacterium]